MADSFVKQIHRGICGAPDMRQIIFPLEAAAGTGVALGAAGNSPAYSAWVDVILLAGVTLETLVVGFTIDTHSAAMIATVDIGITLSLGVIYATAAAVEAAGALVIAGASRSRTRAQFIAIAAGQGYVVPLLRPVLVPAGVGIIARWQTAAGAETGNLTVMAVQSF